jgi:LDH2 family malate/lactate/ureidoglycolate dehydrogenase
MPLPEFEARVSHLVAEVRSSAPAEGSPGVFVPGELELLKRSRLERAGVPLPEATWRGLAELARTCGVEAAV